jgi:hypothetical protein
LAELARSAVQDWVQASFAHKIDLGFEAPSEPVQIVGNPTMLRELLSNLIDNALRYTPAGGSVTVRVRGSEGERGYMEVEDTGPGIAPAERGACSSASIASSAARPKAAAWDWPSCARSPSSTAPKSTSSTIPAQQPKLPGQRCSA